MEFDTIVAVATAPGEGAIGIIRLSGDEAQKILHDILEIKRTSGPVIEIEAHLWSYR